MIRRLFAALASMAALAAMLVGLPVVLWVLGRQWLPDHIPTLTEIWTVLGRPDDGSLFAGALVLIGFGVWACLLFGFLIELPSQLGLLRHAVRMPTGLGWSQQVAGGLLAVVLSLAVSQVASATAAPASAQMTTQAAVGPVYTEPVATPTPAPPAAPTAPVASTYTVVRGDTLWQIAETTMGDGIRYTEILDLNRGIPQADGGALTAAGDINEGWVLALPADAVPASAGATVEVVVEAGDTLSEIATEEGLPSWQPIFAANAGEVQPGGRLFDDPDLIFPGQALDVPVPTAITAPPPPPIVDEPAPAPPAAAEPEPMPEPAPPPAAEEPVPVGLPAPAAADGAQSEPQTSQADAAADGELATVTPLTLAGAGLLAVGVIGSLEALRRNQKRARRTNRMIRTPKAGAAHAEAELRRAENPGGVYFLDLVLRNLSAYLAGRPAESMPDVLAARLGAEDLELLLASPAGEAPPWAQPSPDGLRWRILTTADLPVLDAAADHLAPLPALVTVGVLAEDDMLLDLERMGSWAISGPDEPLRGLMRFIAIELAHNAWSDQLAVTCVGFGSELVELNPDRLRYAERLGDVLTRMERKVDQILSSIIELDAGGVLAGRVNAVAGDTWMPEVILLGATPDEEELASLERLLDVMSQHPRVAAGIVLAGTVPGAKWHARIDHSGRLDLEELGLQVQAKTFDIPTAKLVLQLVETARDTEDQPIPASPSVAGWTAPGRNAAGGVLEDGDMADREAAAVAEAADAAVVELRPAAAARDAQRDRILARDPNLDADLAAWVNGAAPVRIEVMGQISVTAPGPLAKRRDFYTELVVFLATAPTGGVSADELTTALWGESPTAASSTRTADLSRARAWLGAGADGTDLLSIMGADGRYRLSEEVRQARLDWSLFRRLRTIGEDLDEEAGEPYLRAALELVAGRPYRNNRPTGYAWLARAPISVATIEAGIMDTATRLGELYLGRGDTQAARWVAEQAQLADDQAAYDQPYRILMRSAHAEGKPAEIQALIHEMVDRRDVEDELDLHPETCRLIERLLPYQRGRSSSG